MGRVFRYLPGNWQGLMAPPRTLQPYEIPVLQFIGQARLKSEVEAGEPDKRVGGGHLKKAEIKSQRKSFQCRVHEEEPRHYAPRPQIASIEPIHQYRHKRLELVDHPNP